LIAEATLAMRLEATVEDVIATIHAHPTLAETFREAALVAAGRPIHTAR
jgi:dihydrolipoamide dehydrogenase